MSLCHFKVDTFNDVISDHDTYGRHRATLFEFNDERITLDRHFATQLLLDLDDEFIECYGDVVYKVGVDAHPCLSNNSMLPSIARASFNPNKGTGRHAP